MWDNLKKAANFADFEELLADTLISQFSKLGGDPKEAVRSAQKYNNSKDWIRYHKSQTIAAGVGSGLIPGAGLALMSADLTFLLHKLSYMSWGIGAIRGCKVYSKADFLHILHIWGEDETEMGDLSAVSYGFIKAVNAAASLHEFMQLDQLSEIQELVIYNELGKLYSAQGSIAQALSHWGNHHGNHGLKVKIGRKKLAKVSVKLSQKLAKKLATKIVSKMAAKFLLGFVPIVGAAVSAYLNHWLMEGIGSSAERYYSKAIKL